MLKTLETSTDMYNQNRPNMQQYSPQMRQIQPGAQPGMVHVQNYISAQPSQQMPQYQQYQQVGNMVMSPPQQVGGMVLSPPQQISMVPVHSGGGSNMAMASMHNVQQEQAMRGQGQFQQAYQLQSSQQPTSTSQLLVSQPQLSQQKFPSYQVQQQQISVPRLQQPQPLPQVAATSSVKPVYVANTPSGSVVESVASSNDNTAEMSLQPPASDLQEQKAGPSKLVTPDHGNEMLTKTTLDELVQSVDKYVQLDQDVKEVLLSLADNFIENVARGACQIAKHRKAATLDSKDVQLCLERNWNMWLPGYNSDDSKPYKKSSATEAHLQRMAIIKKKLKKIN